MKKFLTFIILFSFTISIANASQWIEIFEKQYIDFESIELYQKANVISFWVKKLRTDTKEKFLNMDYWYSINKWSISCNAKYSRIESVAIYDLKQKLLYSDDTIPEWNFIMPDTYAEGYYKLFCSVPLNENPIFKNIFNTNH